MSNQLDSFVTEVDTWIEENCPKSMRTPMPVNEQVWASSEIQFPTADSKIWFDAMVSRGWCTPEWPVEYGGGGLSFEEAKILRSRLKFFGCIQKILSGFEEFLLPQKINPRPHIQLAILVYTIPWIPLHQTRS